MDFDIKDGLSYLDNIPFKISSGFIPPPAVVLPPLLNEELDIEKFHYDFSMEKKALEDIQEIREKMKTELKTDTSKAENMCNKFQDASSEPSKQSNVQSIFSLPSDILLPKPQKILDKVSNSDGDSNSKINLSDFENDMSSPFDYMELQTINDLEELSSVFQGLNNKYNSDDNMYKDKNSVSSGLNQNNIASNFSKSMSFPLQNTEGLESSEKLTNEAVAQSQEVWRASLSLTKENCFLPNQNSDDIHCGKQTSVLPKVPCLASPSVKNNNVEFSDKSSLRVCKSYSDIHNLSEQPFVNFTKQGRSSTPPATETKLPVFSDHENEISPGDVNCDNSPPLSGLPDPYNELPEYDRKFVDAIADMGFPRAQVSRTVKHLGADEKTVVEHLCQIQILEESGYDCLEAEAALHLHDYNQDQAKKFLDLINKFQDLGFEKNAVKKALIQNKNDWGKTIDALLS